MGIPIICTELNCGGVIKLKSNTKKIRQSNYINFAINYMNNTITIETYKCAKCGKVYK